MKEFYDEMIKKMRWAKKVKPVYGYINNVIRNWPANRDIAWGYHFNTPSISQIKFMHHWEEMPVVVSAHYADSEWVVEHCLRPLRFHYGCTFEMETWGSLQKIIYKTEIMGVPVVIQLMDATECKWEEVQETTYKLNCAEAA